VETPRRLAQRGGGTGGLRRLRRARFGKIAISFGVDPYGSRASIMTVETRIRLTDPDSRRRVLRYWRMVGPFGQVIRWQAF
jgi:hypothetical protein